MEEHKNQIQLRNKIPVVLSIIKKNLSVIIVIMILSIVGGVVYIKAHKPVYTAKETVNYIAYASDETLNVDVVTSVRIMMAYLPSVKDFSTTGCVLDRANSYYEDFIKKNPDGENISEYVRSIKKDPYSVNVDLSSPKVFTESNTGYENNAYDVDNEQYCFNIFVKSQDEKQSKNMVRIYALAFDIEARDYFGGVKTYIIELVGEKSEPIVRSDVSKIKTFAISILAGLVLSFATIYVKYMLNFTIKNEDELKEITGVDTLSYIEYTE